MNYIYKDIKIKTFKLEDLIGRDLRIKKFKSDEGIDIITATDLDTGELFVLEQIRHPMDQPSSGNFVSE